MNPEAVPASRRAVPRGAGAADRERAAFSTAPAAATRTCAAKWTRCCARTTQAGDFIATPAAERRRHRSLRPSDAGTLSGRIGAYEVLSLIGRGGMGEVYLAQDSQARPQSRGEAAPARADEQPRRGSPLRAGSARRLLAQPPEHRHDLRDRRYRAIAASWRWSSSRASRSPTMLGGAVERRRRWRTWARSWRGRWPWRTPPASCTATSSPRTSWCARTAT